MIEGANMKYKLMILLGILLLLAACEIKKPSLPVWDVDLSVPLINEHYYVSDLLENEHFTVDGDSLLYLTTQGGTQTNVLDVVEVEPNINLNNLPVLSGANTTQTIPFNYGPSNVNPSFGVIESGVLKIRIDNVAPAAGTWHLEITIPTLTDAGGAPLRLFYTTAKAWHSIDLHGYGVGVRNSPDPLENLDIQITSSSALPNGAALAAISFQMNGPLSFSMFQGYFDHYEALAANSASDIAIDYPLHLDDAITLQDAFIEIAVSNQIDFSCEFTGWFRATRGNTVITIPILDDEGTNFRIGAGTVDHPTLLTFTNRISELMQIMPERIEIVDVKFIIDTASGYGTLHNTDYIYAHYTVLSPFRFTLHNKSIIVEKPTKISISAENQERISKNVLEAVFKVKALNTVPLGARAYAYFADHEAIDIADPTTYSFVKQVALGSSLTHPDWQDLELLDLNRAELDLFTAPKVYLKWVFHFDESTDLVEVHAGLRDFIWIKGQILASVRVEDL